MKNRLTAIFGIFFAFSSFASPDLSSPKLDQSCWDGSFHYKYVTLVETDNRVEVSFQGSDLGALTLPRSNETFRNDHWGSRIYLAFKKENCSLSPDKKSGRCEKAGNILWESLFVGRDFNNLFDVASVITSFPTYKIAVEFSPTNVKATIVSALDDGREQNIQFKLTQCYPAGDWDNAFPPELKKHLDSLTEQ